MPFTLAHPAAIIPIHKAIGSRTSLSALVIGSMMPDLVYFVPLGVSSHTSHTLRGILTFSIPAGLITFALFHLLLKRPATALLPASIQSRLPATVSDPPAVRGVFLLTVIMSLGLGAFTHIAWDAFTHANTFLVKNIELLRTVVGVIGGYQLHVYKILQHLSSVIGLLALALWLFNWTKATPPTSPASKGADLPFRVRALTVAGILGTGLIFAVVNSASRWGGSVERVLMRAAVGGLVGAVASAAVFCIGWHAFHLCRRRGTQDVVK